MRQAPTNANRLVRALALSNKKSGHGRPLLAHTLYPKSEYRRLFLVLASVVVTCLLLVFVQFPTSASHDATVTMREAMKNRSNSSLMVTPHNSISPSTTSAPDEAMRQRLREAFGNVPLSFEANRGQTDAQVKFLCRGSGYMLFLTSSGAVFVLQRPAQSSEKQRQSTETPAPATTDILRMRIMDSNPTAKIEGLNQLPGHSNYFIGRDAAKWFPNIPNYSKVQHREIYRGIDLVYYGNQRELENDFIIAPAADPRTINLSFAGAKSISISQDGALLLKTAGGQFQLQKPVAYQDVDGSRHEIAVKYELRDAARSVVGFDVAGYDRSRPLIIDPVFIYSTFQGGLASDVGSDIALDSSGNAYVAGYTGSANFPTLNPVQGFQPSRSAFVTKINAAGSALVYSTYLGGSNSGSSQFASGIAVDATGNAYLTGLTISSDFPTTANAFQQTKPTGATANAGFVTKLTPSGTLAYSTYLGATQGTQPFAIATDGAGNAYVTGTTGTGFPLTASAFSSSAATTGFLTKLNTNAAGASALVYSTFLGTLGTIFPRGITVDAAGNAYVTGAALSNATGFASAEAFQTTFGGGFSDAFVAKFNTNASGASSRVYSTYLGGSGDDSGSTSQASGSRAIAIDATGNAYITGRTTSTNYPVANAFQANKAGTTTNAFLTKLNSTGSGLVYSTYFGGNTAVGDEGSSVAVNVLGNAYVTGLSNSSDFPSVNPITPVQSTGRIFLAKFTPEGNALVYSTRMGTNQGEFGLGVALDGAGNAFITGTAFSGLPTTAGAFQTTNAGIGDAFISQVADPTIIGRVVDENGNPISTATVNLTGVPAATTTTDANGYFTFGLLTVANNYTVSVSVASYIFNSQVVNNLQRNVRLDFSPVVFSIGGQVLNGTAGASGVTMTLSDGKSLTTLTNASGVYSFTNLPAGRNYTIAPSLAGYFFTPTSRAFTNLLANQTADFAVAFQATLNSWTFLGRSYVYVKLSFPDSGYSVTDWGTPTNVGNDFSANASVTRLGGTPIQAVTTTAQIYDLGPLANGTYTFAFRSSGITVRTLQFIISSTVPPPNPIDDQRQFVRQQYLDFLNREPDQAGLDFWTDNITKCADPARRPAGQTEAQCTLRQRETTSGAFFLSPEFQYTGYFVYRMYQGALRRQPKLSEFLPDAQFVGNGIVVNGQLSGAKINQNKGDYAALFVNCNDATKYRCAEFKAIYDPLTNQQYVDRLFQNTGANPSASERTALVNGLNGATETRASVLQKVVDGINVISEGNQQFTTTYGQAFYNSEFNRAFVLLEYFGYMKRDPDEGGYAFWLGKLNQFGGNFVNAEMVLAFISSPEYRSRFGPPQPPTDNQPPAGSLTPEQRVAALDAVSARFQSLINTNPDRNAVNQELLNFIRSRPEFAESGIIENSYVWATYIDGVELVVVNEDLPEASTVSTTVSNSSVSATLGPQPQLANLPDSDQARLFFASGPGFPDPTVDISSMLKAQGYKVVLGTPTVDGFKTVAGDGVFYYRGHGSLHKDGYALSTTEPVTPALDKTYVDDIEPLPGEIIGAPPLHPRLRYVTTGDNILPGGKRSVAKHYGITGQFIQFYWKPFSPNCFVYIDASHFATSPAIHFHVGLKEKNASVYAGWTGEVGALTASETAKFVFDRLLGANFLKAYEESGFKQRPFDYPSVKDDLARHALQVGGVVHQLGREPKTGAELDFRQLPNGNFRLLAPSIARMRVDEDKSELILEGIFGDNPGDDGKVTVNGQRIAQTKWENNEIRCNLPLLGPQSSGDVIVEVRGHKSNVAQLTEWQGKFTHTYGLLPLKQVTTYNVRFRADIREYRPKIHEAPVMPKAIVTATLDSKGDYGCSGTVTCKSTLLGTVITTTATWIGSGPLQTGPLQSSPPNGTFFMYGEFKLDLASPNLSLFFITFNPKTCVQRDDEGEEITFPFFDFVSDLSPGGSPEVNFDVTLDKNADIGADSLTGRPISVNCAPECNFTVCGFQKMEWGSIKANYPPDPNSAR